MCSSDLKADYERFEFHRIVQALQNFASEDLGAVYLDILKDRLYTTQARSTARRAAQSALWHILQTVVKLMAPILSFTAEEIWQLLCKAAEESVMMHTFHDLPVVGDSVDDVLGTVTIHDLYRASRSGTVTLRDYIRPVEMAPDTMPVTELMDSMLRRHFTFAIVVDEYGQTAGVVTMEDCLEAIFGEIADEFDEESEMIRKIGRAHV